MKLANDLFGTPPLPPPGAVFSPCGRYRYSLTRTFAPGPRALWIGHNPSYACAERNDPTVTRMEKFSQGYGCGGLWVANPFALCGTDPSVVLTEFRRRAVYEPDGDPVGPKNDAAIREALSTCNGPVIVCWGNVHKDLRWRIAEVLRLLDGRKLYALGFTADGSPKHPCARGKASIPYGTPLVEYVQATATVQQKA